ncbi:hypothetical protein Cgig2_023189 [Carnegiea gigantea]|uniref:DUF155 domain-containing protein n=1 Tax=Carnegiea gigantea TaxID=171969 RepID=A0A9Q1JYA5_9CARY|nr:hypothetical protein Cgig2_023189 [Carnegiea gigantea]
MGRWALHRLLRRFASSSSYSASNLSSFSLTSKPHAFSSFCSNPTSKFRRSRPLSYIPSSSATALAVELDYGSGCPGENFTEEIQPTVDGEAVVNIPVKAFFFATSINLGSMQAEYGRTNVVSPTSSRTPKYIALGFHDVPSKAIGMELHENVSRNRYMVVFQYGSAVLLNVEDHEVDLFLNIARRHASGLLKEEDMRKDDYTVKEKPELVEEMQGGADYMVLKHLDIDGIRIIGSVLGESIALEYSESQVDSKVKEFADINREMEMTGNFNMHRKKLFQLVGAANSILADIILKVGLFDRSEIAWREAKYAQIYEYLREEYEVAQRFGNLQIKLKFVEHNIHFLQEVLQNRKSDLLEWCIIILLSIENVISLYEIIRNSTAGSV